MHFNYHFTAYCFINIYKDIYASLSYLRLKHSFISVITNSLLFLFFFLFNLFFYIFLLLFKYSCLHFPPLPPSPQPSPPSTLDPTTLWFCPCVHYRCSWKPLLLFLIFPSHLPSGYCQCVLNFTICGCILLTCLFCWLGSC